MVSKFSMVAQMNLEFYWSICKNLENLLSSKNVVMDNLLPSAPVQVVPL